MPVFDTALKRWLIIYKTHVQYYNTQYEYVKENPEYFQSRNF